MVKAEPVVEKQEVVEVVKTIETVLPKRELSLREEVENAPFMKYTEKDYEEDLLENIGREEKGKS